MKTSILKIVSMALTAYLAMSTSLVQAQTNDPLANEILEITLLEQIGENVFEDQGVYLHEYALINVGILFPYSAFPAAEINAVQTRLNQAAQAIGNYFSFFYGANIGNALAGYYAQYNSFAFQYNSAAKAGNNVQKQQIFNQWIQYGNAIADFLHSVNPFIDKNIAEALFQQQINLEADQVNAYIQQNFTQAINFYDVSRAHLRQIGDYFALAGFEFLSVR